MNATPESIAEKYAADWFTLPPGCRTKGALGAQIESAIAEAIREALAPVEAERDAARAELAARAATDAAGALGRKP